MTMNPPRVKLYTLQIIGLFADADIEALEAKIAELREQLIFTNQQAQEIQSAADQEDRQLTEEEQTQLNQLTEDFDRIRSDVQRRERIVAQQRALSTPRGRQTDPDPVGASAAQASGNPAAMDAARTEPRVLRHGQQGFQSFGEYARAVHASSLHGGRVDPRLVVIRAATPGGTTTSTEGAGPDGGFAVPPDYRNAIMQLIMGEESLLSRCDQQMTTSNNLVFPVDETTRHGSSGIKGYWDGEGQVMTQSKISLGQRNVRLHKLHILCPVSEELLEDTVGLDSYLTRVASEEFDWKINDAIINGNGAGMPLGILNSGALVTVAKEGSQAADTVLFANIAKMWSRAYGRGRSNMVWLINQDVEQQLLNMTVPIKNVAGTENVGGGGPIYLPGQNAAGAPFGTLMGRPVIPTEACKTVGDLGDILFVNLNRYMAGLKTTGIRQAMSMHLWFDYDVLAFKFIFRMAGQPWWSAPMARASGTNTLSPFVALAERS